MTRAEFVERTKKFALAVVELVEALPTGRTADVVGKQLLRAGTSVAANYRAACRARSRREFIAKMGIVEEEAERTRVNSGSIYLSLAAWWTRISRFRCVTKLIRSWPLR